MRPGSVRFFKTPADFRRWLQKHHASADELWVGYYKVHTGRPSLTWPESVDQALCFGWIDGIRKRLDDSSYTIRFTPRRPRSRWSAVNLKRASELAAEGLMQPAGLKAYEARQRDDAEQYSYEQRRPELEEPYAARLKRNKNAWAFFQAQPPSYRKAAAWWVMSAKKEDTRQRRLEQLIADSAAGRTIPPLTRPKAPPRARPRAAR